MRLIFFCKRYLIFDLAIEYTNSFFYKKICFCFSEIFYHSRNGRRWQQEARRSSVRSKTFAHRHQSAATKWSPRRVQLLRKDVRRGQDCQTHGGEKWPNFGKMQDCYLRVCCLNRQHFLSRKLFYKALYQYIFSPTPTLMAFTVVTNAYGPLHHPKAYR